jgi:hypothetical protein
MKTYTMDRPESLLVGHNFRRHELRSERKTEVQKLERLKALLEKKFVAKLERAAPIQAA